MRRRSCVRILDCTGTELCAKSSKKSHENSIKLHFTNSVFFGKINATFQEIYWR